MLNSVTGTVQRATGSEPSRRPKPHGLIIRIPARCQPVAQTLRPYVGPVLFDVVQTRSAVRFAVNHPPAGWNIGEGGPQAVLLFVIDQNEEGATVVVERIDAHRFSISCSRNECTRFQTILEADKARPGFRTKFLMPPQDAGDFRCCDPAGALVNVTNATRFS